MSFRFVTGLTRWARLTVNSAALRRLYRDVLVRCRIGKTRDLAERRLAHPRPDAVDESELHTSFADAGGLLRANPFEQRGAGLGEFLDGVGELVAVIFVEGDREGEHAALGKPDAAGEEIEIEEVAERTIAAFSVFLRADRRVGHVDRQHG